MKRRPPRSTRTDTLFPYTTLFRSDVVVGAGVGSDAQSFSHVLAQPVDLLGSDVASDVQLAGTEALLHRRAFFHGVVDDLVDGDIVRIVELVVLDQRGLDLGSPANQLEIGRVSCRERVCQYV